MKQILIKTSLFFLFLINLDACCYRCGNLYPNQNPVPSQDVVQYLFSRPFIGTVDLLPSEKKPTGIVTVRETNPLLESSYVRSFVFNGSKHIHGDDIFKLKDTVYFVIKKKNGMLVADSLFKWKSFEAERAFKKDNNNIRTTRITNTVRDSIFKQFGCLDLGHQYRHHISETHNFHTKLHLGVQTTDTLVMDGLRYIAYNLFFNNSPIPGNPYYIPDNRYEDFKRRTNNDVVYFMTWFSYNNKRIIDDISLTHNHPGN